MMIYVLGYDDSHDEWHQVCQVEADNPESPVSRIVSVTDTAAVEHIVAWNIANYPEFSSPRMLAADLPRGTYGLAPAPNLS